MTVEGYPKENRAKYKILENVLNKFNYDRIIIAGDMNWHAGIVGEKMGKLC